MAVAPLNVALSEVLVAVSVYVMVSPGWTVDPGAGLDDFSSVHAGVK